MATMTSGLGAQTRLPFARNRNEARYRAWAATHQDVLELFLRHARERMALGRRFGMKALWERVRWDEPVPIDSTDGWRLNNSYVSYVARDLLALEPRLEQFIETRRVQGDD